MIDLIDRLEHSEKYWYVLFSDRYVISLSIMVDFDATIRLYV